MQCYGGYKVSFSHEDKGKSVGSFWSVDYSEFDSGLFGKLPAIHGIIFQECGSILSLFLQRALFFSDSFLGFLLTPQL